MKTAIRIMAAGLAASLALVSCAKQDVIDNGSANPAGGARTIAVSFANKTTKTTLEGLQPKFVANDVIKVSNGSAAEYCFVSIDGSGNASITTSLTGSLTMVYPSTAAKMNGNAIDGILVPTVQDGSFASANICKAEIAAGATSATFANQTAVFCITPGAGAGTKYVEVITAGAEIANSVPEGSEYDTMHKIHVASASAAPVYVSILVPTGLKFRDLSFADGNNMKTLKDDTAAIAVNSLYTVTNENWNRPYVDLQMTVGGKNKTYKWATMNVGATKPEDYGEYFAWGEKTGHKANSAKTGFEDGHSFDWEHTPYHTGIDKLTGWTKYIPKKKSSYWSGPDDPDDKLVLDPEDDAANANWGGSWRMPTKQPEFQALKNATYWAWHSTDIGYYVFAPDETHTAGEIGKFIPGDLNKADALLFFPAAGYGDGAILTNVGTGPCLNYWLSSPVNSSSPQRASTFYFDSDYFSNNVTDRYLGCSVRPVSD